MSTSKSNKKSTVQSSSVLNNQELDNLKQNDDQLLTGDLLESVNDQPKNDEEIVQDEQIQDEQQVQIGPDLTSFSQQQLIEVIRTIEQLSGREHSDLSGLGREQLLERYKQLIDQVRILTSKQVNTTGQLLSGNNSVTKADIARRIWDEEMVKQNMGCPVRGDTIKRLMDKDEFIGCEPLTKAGAATYYQNMKKKAGFVNSK